MNPQRKLPTLLTPSGEVLTESAAIVIVLDERHPAAGLLPATGSPERAQALRWLLFLASELYPIVEINDYPERFAPEGVPAEAMREQARRIWRERWLTLEAQIQGAPWLLPSGFCFTDVYLAAVSRWAQQADFRRTQTPRVERIAEAVAARPVLAPILAPSLPKRGLRAGARRAVRRRGGSPSRPRRCDPGTPTLPRNGVHDFYIRILVEYVFSVPPLAPARAPCQL